MTVEDIGLCKALNLEDIKTTGRLFQIDDRYYLYSSAFDFNDAGNIGSSEFLMTQVKEDTICAYTYMNDINCNKVYAFDVLRLPEEPNKYVYVYWDDVKNMWLYITSYDSSKDERLNINELELTDHNMLLDGSMYAIFGSEGL